MSVLNIRGVPEELSNAVKIAAVKAGIPIREFVIKSLGDSLGVNVSTINEVGSHRRPASPKAQQSGRRARPRTIGSRTRSVRTKSAVQSVEETIKPKGPKQEFCKHKLRFCQECVGFH